MSIDKELDWKDLIVYLSKELFSKLLEATDIIEIALRILYLIVFIVLFMLVQLYIRCYRLYPSYCHYRVCYAISIFYLNNCVNIFLQGECQPTVSITNMVHWLKHSTIFIFLLIVINVNYNAKIYFKRKYFQ